MEVDVVPTALNVFNTKRTSKRVAVMPVVDRDTILVVPSRLLKDLSQAMAFFSKRND